MIRLALPKEPYWIELSYGVRLLVRPLTTAEYTAAQFRGTRQIKELLESKAEIEEAGGKVTDLPDMSNADAMAGVSQLVFAQALAQSAIVEWEGVADKEGEPAEVNEETVQDLMQLHRIAEDFVVEYTKMHEQVIAEGNGSGSAASGTSATDPSTATDAEETASPAAAQSPG